MQWFSDAPSEIVYDTITKHFGSQKIRILEIGCGEGRDANFLLSEGYDVLATDISPTAIAFCQKNNPEKADCFQVLDCLNDNMLETFDFIYAVAVLHMLVLNEDRHIFFDFIQDHLNDDGIALVCSMGNGEEEWKTDIAAAFKLFDRKHDATGKVVTIAGTSCRVVSFDTLANEIKASRLVINQKGNTSVLPDFQSMIYVVVRKQG